ncbi:MAG: bifunctional aspartate kinase/homoserine dehydrogenase I [Treponemataceae bacterium]|nr:MAG: bifunctional aspartate kinase/homoserine dehydrogenase I [Treponemataceae bacterium]
MGSAGRIVDSCKIMRERMQNAAAFVVVSAVSGVSNALQQSINDTLSCDAEDANSTNNATKTLSDVAVKAVAEIRLVHENILTQLEKILPDWTHAQTEKTLRELSPLFSEYARLLDAVKTIGECPLSLHCRIMGLGELLCVPIVRAVLECMHIAVELLDSRNYIFTVGNQDEGDLDYEATEKAFLPIREALAISAKSNESESAAKIYLFPGFICTWQNKFDKKTLTQMGLLGRNGSDFSASIIAYASGCKKIEFWTDVDGIFTADPRIVHDAIMIDDMSYEEAMELSFFGSKVLHPKTLSPLIFKSIEAWSLNTLNPASHGTRISQKARNQTHTVCGISCLKNTAMVSMSGPGMKDKNGTAARTFSAVSAAGASVLLITQSSSEYTISFCINQDLAPAVIQSLKNEFDLEIASGIINPVSVQYDCAVVSIVGDNMKEKSGVASTFFSALTSGAINVIAIAQGSSERSISAVITLESGDKAVRLVHRFFFNTARPVDVFIFGTGSIGACLIEQIKSQMAELAGDNIEIKVLGIARSKKLLLSENGNSLDLRDWQADLAKIPENHADYLPLDAVLDYVRIQKPLNPVFVDCTASSALPERYLDIFKAGMHIATPNKKANSMAMDYYAALRKAARTNSRKFLYETNVGAGLPVIDTLQHMIKSGDKLKFFSGIMSGSLSYIFGRLDDGARFSEAVFEAREKQFTEPDPRDDLSGMDVARKALIIAREAGLKPELSDIRIKKLFPADFDDSGDVETFLKNLPKVDAYFSDYMTRLKKSGKTLRMGASIEDGICTVGLIEVSTDNPLFAIKGGENAFVFTTVRYNPIPLVVRGYGAGAQVTAAGVFGDILRTA